MINKNSHSNNEYRYPFLLRPVGKDYLWGGERLNTEFGKNINLHPLAETWECSTHQDGVSQIASGIYAGTNLTQFISEYPGTLGNRYQHIKELPILVKFIDAKQNLSVQVHPSDEYARENENGQLGKSEMWYIVDAIKDAKIIYGFNHNINANQVESSIKNGNIEKYLNSVSVKKDEIFFIEAGTVHAIGAGTLIAEIQENSNLTYRLYDYNRLDKDGNKRQLHIEKALKVLNYKSSDDPRQPMRVLKYQNGCASELLCRCKYFEVSRLLVNTEVLRTTFNFQSDSLSFRVLLCLNGCGSIRFEQEGKIELIDFYKGDTIFVPANSVVFGISGKVQFLDVRC